ncbi:MAG: hypothetical protein K2X93_19860 [Candidatus Obscuribacterales bacterium]|nr:hypothetical protein [Candidatus Obscuribacterales bacterium]
MTNKTGEANGWILCALCSIAAATMIVEIVLTKFIAFKVFHHYITVIISTVILSFGAAGTVLYLRSDEKKSTSVDNWKSAGFEAFTFSILLVAAVLLFCWLPIDPYNANLNPLLRIASVPIYFIIFAIPFYFGGMCISRVLAQSSIPITRVYLFDLLFTAIAASLTPFVLDFAGGYATIALAAAFGLLAAASFFKATGNLTVPRMAIGGSTFAVALTLLLMYPSLMRNNGGFDIRSNKYQSMRDLVFSDFHGLAQTYWNALARIDITHTGASNHNTFLYGIAPNSGTPKLEGRLIMADCGANTRQFRAKGNIDDHKLFGDVLFGVPYVIKPDAKDALVLGGGGGIDIIVGKFFHVPRMDVVELNPMTYKHALLGQDDPESALYQPWLVSDKNTTVSIFNAEGRHFASVHPPHTYDVIQASGVDTLTAVASGALAFSDNYLYTMDAVKCYMRQLKPGGVLSLTHWRLQPPPTLALRMFVTYLRYLDEQGVKEPWRHVLVIGPSWVDSVLKAEPFTDEELERVRAWCKRTGNFMIFDPGRKAEFDQAQAAGTTGTTTIARESKESGPFADESEQAKPDTSLTRAPEEEIYDRIGFADSAHRQAILDSYVFDVNPVTDDKPYFYHVERAENWVLSSAWASTPIAATVSIALFALLLLLAPIKKMKGRLTLRTAYHAFFFAVCGFAFLLFEVCIIQMFSVSVGGPMYSLAVVLVSVLGGYSIGAFVAGKLPIKPQTFFILAALLLLLNIGAWLGLPPFIEALWPLPFAGRIACCAAVTLLLSIATGIPVSLGMEAVKRKYPSEVAWLWGVNSAFNALGSVSFVLISQQIGIAATLAIVAVLYLIANIVFAYLGPVKTEN